MRRLRSEPVTCSIPEREEDEDDEAYYMRAKDELVEHYQGNTPWF